MASLSVNMFVSSVDYPATRRNDSPKRPATAIQNGEISFKKSSRRLGKTYANRLMNDKNRQIRKKMKKRVFRGGQQHWSGI